MRSRSASSGHNDPCRDWRTLWEYADPHKCDECDDQCHHDNEDNYDSYRAKACYAKCEKRPECKEEQTFQSEADCVVTFRDKPCHNVAGYCPQPANRGDAECTALRETVRSQSNAMNR
jgi:hypothetical protein